MGLSNNKFKQSLSRDEVDYFLEKVSFSEPEINDWYHEFKKHCKIDKSDKFEKSEEYLTEKDFLAVYQKVYPGDSSDYVHHIFRTFDTDGNGRVSFREFLIGLHVSGTDDMEEGLRWAFSVFDIKRNGEISTQEMAEIVRSVYKMLDPKRVQLPVEYATPDLVVEKMFQAMDKNHDQCLTWEEFRDGVMKDPFLFNLLQCSPPQKEHETEVFDHT